MNEKKNLEKLRSEFYLLTGIIAGILGGFLGNLFANTYWEWLKFSTPAKYAYFATTFSFLIALGFLFIKWYRIGKRLERIEKLKGKNE